MPRSTKNRQPRREMVPRIWACAMRLPSTPTIDGDKSDNREEARSTVTSEESEGAPLLRLRGPGASDPVFPSHFPAGGWNLRRTKRPCEREETTAGAMMNLKLTVSPVRPPPLVTRSVPQNYFCGPQRSPRSRGWAPHDPNNYWAPPSSRDARFSSSLLFSCLLPPPIFLPPVHLLFPPFCFLRIDL